MYIQKHLMVFVPRWWPFDALEQNIYIYTLNKTMQFHSSPLNPMMSRTSKILGPKGKISGVYFAVKLPVGAIPFAKGTFSTLRGGAVSLRPIEVS